MATESGTPMTLQRFLGERLRALRHSAGLSQEDAAAAAGMTRSQYAHIESGRNAVASTRLPALATAFGLTSSELLAAAWETPGTTKKRDAESSGTTLMWSFDPHSVSLSAGGETAASQGKWLLRLQCEPCSTVLWSTAIAAGDPVAVLACRKDATIVQAVARHVVASQGSIADRLDAEALLVGLGGSDAWHVLDRYADDVQTVERKH